MPGPAATTPKPPHVAEMIKTSIKNTSVSQYIREQQLEQLVLHERREDHLLEQPVDARRELAQQLEEPPHLLVVGLLQQPQRHEHVVLAAIHAARSANPGVMTKEVITGLNTAIAKAAAKCASTTAWAGTIAKDRVPLLTAQLGAAGAGVDGRAGAQGPGARGRALSAGLCGVCSGADPS